MERSGAAVDHHMLIPFLRAFLEISAKIHWLRKVAECGRFSANYGASQAL